MIPADNLSSELIFLIIITAVPLLCLILCVACKFICIFSQELNYINSEIMRSEGQELKYWKKQRRRLWLSLIPFVKYY